MHRSAEAEVDMFDKMSRVAISQGLKQFSRQRHDKNRKGRDDAAENHHRIGRKSLGERANDWNEDNDEVAVDVPQFTDRCAFAKFANAEGGEYVVHLHED